MATRGRGTMRSWLARSDVEPYLSLVDDAGPLDDVARTRLLIVRSFWPDAFRDRTLDDRSLHDAIEAGERAAELAESIGRLDLASAALDGVGSAFQVRGLFGRMYPIAARRLRLARELEDQWEAGDAFAVAAWSAYEVGRYRDAFDLADEGFRVAGPGTLVSALHCLDWRAMARFRLGEWDALLDDDQLAQSMLGERREHPPAFAADHIAGVAFVQEARGDRAAADHALDVLRWLEGAQAVPSPAWIAWRALVLARRGRFDEAWEALERPDLRDLPYARGALLAASCALVAEHGRADGSAWERAPSLVAEARDRAREAGLLALPLVADGLEGQGALAAGDAERARWLLERASAGLHDLRSIWEAALVDLTLAEAAVAAGHPEEARPPLDRASETFERLGAERELERARDVGVARSR